MVFLRQGFRKLSYSRYTDRQTDMTEVTQYAWSIDWKSESRFQYTNLTWQRTSGSITMVLCFAPDCNQYSQRDKCQFFWFPCAVASLNFIIAASQGCISGFYKP